MANIKQKIVRIKTNEKARIRNSRLKSRVRTFIKNAKIAIREDVKNSSVKINAANKEMDKAVSKGVFKKAKANRLKSRLMIMHNKYMRDIATNKIEATSETKK